MAWHGDSPKRTFLAWLMGAVVIYALLSVAIAWNSIDDCGGRDAPKEWSYFPPEWKCTNPFFSG